MRFKHVFQTIETHTGGNPTRTIVGGIPTIHGSTMMEKVAFFRTHYDFIRTALMYEPRGHGVMSGCILTEPVHPEADLGVIYIEVGGYLPMCGHDTIGLVTALIETGRVAAEEPTTSLVLDTPSGIVRTTAQVENGRVLSVSFENVPAFLYAQDLSIVVAGLGEVVMDVAWGGNFYGIIEAQSLGLPLDRQHARTAIKWARQIREAVNERTVIQHPELPEVCGLTHIEYYGEPTRRDADIKNMVIVPPGGVDRSPCGTGTSAKAATLWSRGQLAIGESFVHESITGSIFEATLIAPTRVASYPAVVVRVTGSAAIYGESTFVIEENDLLYQGFLLP